MKNNDISEIITHALTILEQEVGLASSTIKVVSSRSFKPISDFFKRKIEKNYKEDLIVELEASYEEDLIRGRISRNVFNLRIRGTRTLREIYDTGTFFWKGPATKEISILSDEYERILTGMFNQNNSEKRVRNTLSICRRFFSSLANSGINSIAMASAEHIQAFLCDISKARPKSMDDVIGSLRKIDRHLTASGLPGLPHAGLLQAPRARERKIYPCMPQNDLSIVFKSIDRGSAIGKRDYAMLVLAANSGMRAGDIANIKLSDIDWHKNELQILQGKTQNPIVLPLQKGVGAALADYILNGRPESKSVQIFLRSLAPYQRLKDGVSVACVLRRRLKAAGISHEFGDGKTMHGIRRMLGTHMTSEGIPLTTVAQVLGHQNTNSTKPYISLDIEGLRECALGFSAINEGSRS